LAHRALERGKKKQFLGVRKQDKRRDVPSWSRMDIYDIAIAGLFLLNALLVIHILNSIR
jgi:hypothetical protein